MDRRPAQKIVLTGDATLDWMQASQGAHRIAQNWRLAGGARLYRQRGGVHLLGDLIKALLLEPTSGPEWELCQTAPPPETTQPGDPGVHHVYTSWAPFPYGSRPPLDREKHAWRIEHFLGFERSQLGPVQTEASQAGVGPLRADLVVLDDSGPRLRHQPSEWPAALAEHGGWVVVKMAQPVAQGALWERLISQYAERLIVITTAQDLRTTAIQISKRISWERTAQDVAWELTYNPLVNSLTQAAHLVVSFDCAGAILLGRDGQRQVRAQLFFDPLALEEDWERAYPGEMVGYSTCLAAAIVRQILLDPANPEIGRGIQAGVSATRLLHREGYGRRGSGAQQAELCFPFEAIAREICRQEQPLAEARIQDPAGSLLVPPPPEKARLQRGYWTILEDRYSAGLEAVARQIVLDGSEAALRQVPVGRFGGLVTVDRREIEALNGIQRLIAEYCSTPQKKPLSIAVFGPPGAGKSFGVEQVAKSILGEISVLVFNLSQFRHPDALLDALHQVRDVGLSGKIPLVFWDEFDTALDGQPLGWLRYFLAPMQDGAFQEGQIVHPIGRCIFVFAGGTSHRMDLFGGSLSESEQRAVKLPDFVSRLKGFLNVLGPNPIEGSGPDPYFVLRRALILRSIFERNAPQILQRQDGKNRVAIDDGLLRAFLLTSQYRHGVRSMESLVSMSTLFGKSAYERSSLPPEEQLNLHVAAPEFLALMQQLELEGDLLERLAAAAHEVFCAALRAQGYRHGPVTDETKQEHSSLVAYQGLPEDEKDQNRQNVRDIPAKLAIAGYVMRPARSNEPPFEFPGADLELLAEREHERWMRDKLAAGWKYAAQTDKGSRLHQCLLPWDRLPDEEKEKDRVLVRGIPPILAKAGYAIERVAPRRS
ncbi:MAG TPA: RyR domain-containing protein [Anaerolineae bacterium]|nr:RyR domain-containing protein [Anaerolineae bacterium]